MRLVLVLAAALLLAGCDPEDFDSYQANFHYHYALQPGGHLDIENANGSVEIEGWDRSDAEISGVKYASSQRALDAIRIDVRNTSDSLAIRTVVPSYHEWSEGARYTIRVPRQTMIDRVSTSNGPILVRDMGPARTGSPLQTLNLRTSNGRIRAENIYGVIDAQTSNGWVDLDAIRGGASVRTSNGYVTVRLDQLADSPLTVTTSNGGVDLTLRNQPKDSIRAETSNGSITLHLPADTGAHLMADTTHAPISTDFDVWEHFQSESSRNNRIDGKLGNGGPEIELSTHNGHISVLKNL